MWPNFNPKFMPQDYFFEYVLSYGYNVVYEDNNPDILINCLFGPQINKSQYPENTFFIQWNSERFGLDIGADLTFSLHNFDNRNNLRFPFWVGYIYWDNDTNNYYKLLDNSICGQGSHHIVHDSVNPKTSSENPLKLSNILNRHKIVKEKTKFCNFTYSNPVQSRIEYFMRLREYKQVDSTGSLLNNTKYTMCNKSIELSDYKFTIAFENDLYPYYVTEKLLEPLVAGSVPIYWGADEAKIDFNPKSFIFVRDYSDFSESIEYIKTIDSNKDTYLDYLKEPVFSEIKNYPKYFFDEIYKRLITKRPDLRIE